MRAQQHLSHKRGKFLAAVVSFTDYFLRNMGLLFVLIGITIAWAFWGPITLHPNSPPQAMLILTVLTIGTALFVRVTRQRFGLGEPARRGVR